MSEQPHEVPSNLMPGEPGIETDTGLGLSEIEANEAGCGTESTDNSADHDFTYDDDGD